MGINEYLECYLQTVSDSNKNLVNIAFDEMTAGQHDEAAGHFDQLYLKDSTDYMAFFFRAYNKSFCGKRGDVYPDAQTLTSAFTKAVKKAATAKKDYEMNMQLLLQLYSEAMDNLADNAVEQVDSNGHTTNPTRTAIRKMLRDNMVAVAKEYIELIKTYDELKKYVVNYLKRIEAFDLKNIGALIVSYDPSYAETYQKKLKKKKIIKWVAIGVGLVVLLMQPMKALQTTILMEKLLNKTGTLF